MHICMYVGHVCTLSLYLYFSSTGIGESVPPFLLQDAVQQVHVYIAKNPCHHLPILSLEHPKYIPSASPLLQSLCTYSNLDPNYLG
jgi:hypothetical protein